VRNSPASSDQRAERFAVGGKVDARVSSSTAAHKVTVSIKALEVAEEGDRPIRLLRSGRDAANPRHRAQARH
jgi:hypothetical protein